MGRGTSAAQVVAPRPRPHPARRFVPVPGAAPARPPDRARERGACADGERARHPLSRDPATRVRRARRAGCGAPPGCLPAPAVRGGAAARGRGSSAREPAARPAGGRAVHRDRQGQRAGRGPHAGRGGGARDRGGRRDASAQRARFARGPPARRRRGGGQPPAGAGQRLARGQARLAAARRVERAQQRPVQWPIERPLERPLQRQGPRQRTQERLGLTGAARCGSALEAI